MNYTLTSSTLAANAQMVMRSDGAVVPFDENNTDFQAYLSWLAAGNTPSPAPVPTVPPVTLTRFQYLSLFTQAEMGAIASSADAEVKIILLEMEAADSIVLTDPRVKGGLDYLVSAGLLTNDREATILATPQPAAS